MCFAEARPNRRAGSTDMLRHTSPFALYLTVWAVNVAGCGDKAVPYQPPSPERPDATAPAASSAVPSPLHLKLTGNDFNVGFNDKQSFTIGKLPDGCHVIENSAFTMTSDLSSILVIAQCAGELWWQTLWVVESKSPLKVWQRFHFTEIAKQASVRMGARFADKERFELIVAPSGGAPPTADHGVVIPWQMQGRNLARIPEEPEHALRIAVDTAQKALKTNAEAAKAQLDAVLHAHTLLCREVAGPKLTIQDSQQGFVCGRSRATALAAALRFRQLAEAKQVEPALALHQRLLSPAYEMSSDAETAVRAGWNALGNTTEFTLHQGPQVSKLPPDEVRRALEFLDEQTVLVRQSPPVRFRIGSADFEPVDVTASHGYVADPNGKFVVVDVHRQCSAYALGLTPRALLAEPLLATKPTRSVIFTDTGTDARCSSPTPLKDSGGWHVVNWTDQGVLVARAGESRLVPLDADGRSAGPSVSASDAIAASVVGYADSVPGGVVVRIFGSNGQLFLMRPKAWAEQGNKPQHAILSPSGKRVAVIYQQRLAILERTGT
jgi:hypothetical protein